MSVSQRRKILAFGLNAWDGYWQTRQHVLSRLAKRELLSAMLTPVEKIGSTKRPASPTITQPSPQICFIA